MHSNDYATAQSLMVSVTVSSLGATQLHFLEPGVKVNGDLPEYSSAEYASAGYPLCFRGLLRFSARWGTSTSCTWHCHHAAERETLEFIPPEMWPPNSPDLNPVDYIIWAFWGMLQERVYRSQIHDMKELKERLLRVWRLLDHAHRHRGSDCAVA